MNQAQSVVAVYQQRVEVSDSETTVLTPVPPTSQVHLLVDVRTICCAKNMKFYGLLPPERSWAKVIFSQASVCRQGEVCLSTCWDIHRPQSRHAPPRPDPFRAHTPDQTPPEQTPPNQNPPLTRHTPGPEPPSPGPDTPGSRHPPGPDPPGADTPPRTRPPPGSRLQHTVNERPVRILLECILVHICYL